MGFVWEHGSMILAAKAASSSVASLPYRWVGAGANGFLATSDSTAANSWTTRTSSFGTSQIFWVESNGIDNWVAVGAAGKLATSPDGITWTQRTSSFGTTDIKVVNYANNIWVAGGVSSGGTPKFATATDPTGTWTQRTSGFSSGDIQGITFGAGLWAAISSTGEIRTATDPTGTWTLRTSTLTASAGAGTAIRYCSQQNVFVAGFDSGTTGAFASSTDGITWTARNSPVSLLGASGGGRFCNNSSAIITAFTTSTDFDIASSTDGATWTDRTPAATNVVYGQPGVDGNGLIVLPYGQSTLAQSSSDGTTWTAITGPGSFIEIISHSTGL